MGTSEYSCQDPEVMVMPDMFSDATNDVPLVTSWTTILPPPLDDTVKAVLIVSPGLAWMTYFPTKPTLLESVNSPPYDRHLYYSLG